MDTENTDDEMAQAMATEQEASPTENNQATPQESQTVVEKEFGPKAVMDIDIRLSVTLGKSMLRVHQMLKLGRGAVLELDQKLDEPVEIYANDILIAHGDIIVTEEDRIGVSVQDMVKAQ